MKSPARLTGYLATIFLLPALAPAEDLFVRPAHSAGTNTGADWTNAWNGFASITWGDGPGRLGAGDTLWLAGGTYTYPLALGASGAAGAPLTIQRARSSDGAATGVAGWNDALDAQVVITAPAGIYAGGGHGSHTIIDGRTPSGIRINYRDGASGVEFDSARDMTDVTLRYIEAAGPGPIVQSDDTRGFDLTITGVLRNITISHCEIHHSDTLLQVSRSVNLVIEHSSFHHSGAINAAQFHPNAIYLATVQNATIRHNRFHDHSVEGLFFGDPFNTGAKIYGNLFYQGASPRDTGRGIEFDDRADSRDFLVFNNTFVDLPLPGVNFANGQPHPGAVVQNNLFFGCGVLYGPAAHDYNYVSVAGAAERHGVVGTFPPFVSAATFDYRIVGQLAPTLPRNRGTPLAAEFSVDAYGVTRGADGAWDIGAFEFAETRPTSTSSGEVAAPAPAGGTGNSPTPPPVAPTPVAPSRGGNGGALHLIALFACVVLLFARKK